MRACLYPVVVRGLLRGERVGIAAVVSNGLGIIAALCGGWLADRAGRWPVMVWPQLAALLLTYPIFQWIVDTRSAFALLGGLGILALVGTIPYSAFYVTLAEGLPAT